MIRTSIFHLLAPAILFVLATTAIGCSRPADAPEAPPTAPAAASAAAPAPAEQPQFEPAYPADVSSEGLSPHDTEQQTLPHSHDGGEEHTHGEKEEEDDHGHPH